MRLIGESLPAQMAVDDLDFGTGVKVKRIVSHSATEIVAEVDVAADAVSGKRDIVYRRSVYRARSRSTIIWITSKSRRRLRSPGSEARHIPKGFSSLKPSAISAALMGRCTLRMMLNLVRLM